MSIEKPNFNKPESPDAKNESEEKYENGNITFFAEGAKNNGQIEIAKNITETIAPYMDNKVHVQYKKIKAENPGFNSRLNPKFRDENYHDSITINSDYQYQDELPFILAHELGHSFEEKLEQIVKNDEVETLPVGMDDEYADFYADLIAVYILRPELLKKLEDIPAGQNTLLAIQKMFSGNDFTELRTKLNLLPHPKTTIEPDSEEEMERKARLDKLFERVFDKINEYINQKYTREN
ncbi:MAG: hypothetical protein WCS88_02125 [Patescibacteria group bacterium]|jgi:Zn-dependent peptidase ImmA (M78 family)